MGRAACVIVCCAGSLLAAASAKAKTLYVDGATGDDATTWVENGPANPWRTIGRAAWGSTDRTAPNAAEAARAGDTVLVAGGTYDFSGVVEDRFDPVYNPVNAGTPDSYITFECTGECALTAEDTLSPVIGSYGRDYIKWYADISEAHRWLIRACPEDPGGEELCTGSVVAATPDTGPTTCVGSTGCWLEGLVITAAIDVTWGDNWNGVRFEGCSECVARNNTISGFKLADNPYNNHGVCFQLYVSHDCIVEHNHCFDSGGGVGLKDTPVSPLSQSGNVVRFNLFEDIGQVFYVSHVSENALDDRSFFYQNVANRYARAISILGSRNDWFFNNTFHDGTLGFEGVAFGLRQAANPGVSDDGAAGVRMWNTVIDTANYAVYAEGGVMTAESAQDLEHNVYAGLVNAFYGSEAESNRTFASFVGSYSDQDQVDSPAGTASTEADPLLADVAGGDFRPCTAPGAPHAGCTGASPAIDRGVDLHDLDGDGSTTDAINAGAYLTGTEVIGPTTASVPTGDAGVIAGDGGATSDGGGRRDGGTTPGRDGGTTPGAGGDDGCGCSVHSRADAGWIFAIAWVVLRRRRRR